MKVYHPGNGCAWRDPCVAPITNHLKIRIMKEQILKKIGKTLVRINVTDQSAEDAYDELVSSSPRLFGMLSSIYRLNDEEERFAWSAGIQ
jgi:hypothetical protein